MDFRMFAFAATLSQPLTETWQAGLKVFSNFPTEVDSTPCQTLLLKAAAIIHDKLTKIETLERYAITLQCFLSNRWHLLEVFDEFLTTFWHPFDNSWWVPFQLTNLRTTRGEVVRTAHVKLNKLCWQLFQFIGRLPRMPCRKDVKN